LLAAVLAIFIGFHELYKWGIDALRTSDFFAITRIEVLGVDRLTEENVIKLAKIKKGGNLLTINLQEVGRRISEKRWVDQLHLRRILPGTVRIKVKEHRAVALLLTKHLYFLDENGKMIKRAERGEDLDLPVISGLDQYNHETVISALSWINHAEHEGVLPFDFISELHFQNDRLTVYTMGRSIKILADVHGTEDQLHRLKLVLNDLHHRSQIPRQIDLNYRKKVVVKVDNTQ